MVEVTDPGGGNGDGAPTVEYPADVVGFLKSRNLDVTTATAAEIAKELYVANGEEIQRNKKERAARKKAEEALGKLDLKTILGSSEVNEETRSKLEAIMDSNKRADSVTESLKLVAESGIPLTEQLLEVAELGPKSMQILLAAMPKPGAAADDDGQKELPAGADEARNAAVMEITKQVAANLGIGDDLGQRKSKEKKKEGIVDHLAAFRPPKATQDFINRMSGSKKKE